MKLLVTGASGLLGTRICQLAEMQHHKVYAAYSQHTPQSGTFLNLDITDRLKVGKAFEKTGPDAVIHSAALSDVDRCEREKELAWKTNVEATAHIAQLCSTHGCFLVYVSTDYVFNGEKGNYKETDVTGPINYYGLSKLKGEEAVAQSNADQCIARPSVVYGAIPATGKINFALWLAKKLEKKEETRIVTDQWNSPTLNTNLAQMILEIVERKLTGTFHLAGATRLSRYEFAQDIAEAFNLNPEYIIPTSSKEMSWIAQRPRDTSLDINKASQILRIKPLNMSEALTQLKKETHKKDENHKPSLRGDCK